MCAVSHGAGRDGHLPGALTHPPTPSVHSHAQSCCRAPAGSWGRGGSGHGRARRPRGRDDALPSQRSVGAATRARRAWAALTSGVQVMEVGVQAAVQHLHDLLHRAVLDVVHALLQVGLRGDTRDVSPRASSRGAVGPPPRRGSRPGGTHRGPGLAERPLSALDPEHTQPLSWVNPHRLSLPRARGGKATVPGSTQTS